MDMYINPTIQHNEVQNKSKTPVKHLHGKHKKKNISVLVLVILIHIVKLNYNEKIHCLISVKMH